MTTILHLHNARRTPKPLPLDWEAATAERKHRRDMRIRDTHWFVAILAVSAALAILVASVA